MPRQVRIDASGALQHIIARGIEGSKIFQHETDYADFLERLGKILNETRTRCLAFASITTHGHTSLLTYSGSSLVCPLKGVNPDTPLFLFS